jgi:hypothetical protein
MFHLAARFRHVRVLAPYGVMTLVAMIAVTLLGKAPGVPPYGLVDPPIPSSPAAP